MDQWSNVLRIIFPGHRMIGLTIARPLIPKHPEDTIFRKDSTFVEF
jgi:hypothetical protein